MKSSDLLGSASCLLHAGFLLGLYFDREGGNCMFPPKRRLTSNGLHAVISEKTELFMTVYFRTQILK
jgi:hypothetical protein